MNKPHLLTPIVLGLCLLGCEGRPPRHAIPGSNETESEPAAPRSTAAPAPAAPAPASRQVKTKTLYQGRTADQWGQVLNGRDLSELWRAGWALHVLGAEGRPYLLRGLDSPSVDTRRVSLESLTVGDVRSYGDEGRQLLVKLAGDTRDMRIRERASRYLMEWNHHVPMP